MIYIKLTQQYKNISIKLNKNEELIIRKKDIEIKAYEELVLYFTKERVQHIGMVLPTKKYMNQLNIIQKQNEVILLVL